MKSLLLVTSILILSPVYAFMEELKLENINISLDDFSGSVTADNFSLTQAGATIDFDQLEANLDRLSNQELMLEQSNVKLRIKNFDYNQYQFFSKIEFINGHLHWTDRKKVELDFDYGSVAINNRLQYLENFSLDCAALGERSIEPYLFAPCLESAQLSLPELELDQLSSQSLTRALNQKSSPLLTDIVLAIHHKNFTLKARTRFLINIRLTINGDIHYDAKTNQLYIHLDQVKAGIFSVKNRFLRELQDQGLTISGDRLILSF
jgi:hypothetical protein